jgi:hypothetical protein
LNLLMSWHKLQLSGTEASLAPTWTASHVELSYELRGQTLRVPFRALEARVGDRLAAMMLSIAPYATAAEAAAVPKPDPRYADLFVKGTSWRYHVNVVDAEGTPARDDITCKVAAVKPLAHATASQVTCSTSKTVPEPGIAGFYAATAFGLVRLTAMPRTDSDLPSRIDLPVRPKARTWTGHVVDSLEPDGTAWCTIHDDPDGGVGKDCFDGGTIDHGQRPLTVSATLTYQRTK